MTGVIKSAMQEKGYGFIKGEDGHEYFFHNSSVTGVFFSDLKPGRKVQFEIIPSPKGKRAEDVRVL